MYQPTLDIILYILVAKNMKKQTKVKQEIIIIWDFQAILSLFENFNLSYVIRGYLSFIPWEYTKVGTS